MKTFFISKKEFKKILENPKNKKIKDSLVKNHESLLKNANAIAIEENEKGEITHICPAHTYSTPEQMLPFLDEIWGKEFEKASKKYEKIFEEPEKQNE